MNFLTPIPPPTNKTKYTSYMLIMTPTILKFLKLESFKFSIKSYHSLHNKLKPLPIQSRLYFPSIYFNPHKENDSISI